MLVLHKEKGDKTLFWTLEILWRPEQGGSVRTSFGRVKPESNPFYSGGRELIRSFVQTRTIRDIQDKWSKGYRPVAWNMYAPESHDFTWGIVLNRLPSYISDSIMAATLQSKDEYQNNIPKALQIKEEPIVIAKDKQDRLGFILEEIINE